MGLKASVCIDAVFEGWPLESACEATAKLGIPALEFWMWWEKDIVALQSLRRARGLQIAATCTKFVTLTDPSQRDEYLAGLQESIQAAQSLECPVLISQVGDFRVGVSRAEQHASLVNGLKSAAELLRGTGVTLAIEPLNELVDHRGYYLVQCDEAFAVIDEVGSPDVKVTFDIYHQQISEGHLIRNITANIDKIAHFHAAGNPGRHELDCGEIHYPAVFQAIDQTSYDGYIGLEYWPVEEPEAGLKRALAALRCK